MAPVFDKVASSFERLRLLPSGVPEAVRSAIFAAADVAAPAKVLDIGAGTGRIGRPFIAQGDLYIGVDASLPMLREFQASAGPGLLVQAEGGRLPFRDHAFDVVLLMHVVSGARDWPAILNESQRVVRSGGVVVVGRIQGTESGIEGQLKRQLLGLLEELGIEWRRTRESHREAVAWLESIAVRHVRSIAASWNVSVSAREFLERHRSGARFAELPAAIQELALQKLETWAEATFGALETAFNEQRSFALDIFAF